MKPVLLFDVDGVLNILDPKLRRWLGPDHFAMKVNGHTIVWNKETQRCVAELHKEFSLVWATVWNNDANRFIAPIFKLPRLPVCPIHMDFACDVPKLLSIESWIESEGVEKPVAWLDDSIPTDFNAWSSVVYGVPVDPLVGLQTKHVHTLMAWKEELWNPQK